MLLYDNVARDARARREWITGFSEIPPTPCSVNAQDAYELTREASRLLEECSSALQGARVMLKADETPNFHAVAAIESALLRAMEAMGCVWHMGPQDEGRKTLPAQPGSLVWESAERLGLMDVPDPRAGARNEGVPHVESGNE